MVDPSGARDPMARVLRKAVERAATGAMPEVSPRLKFELKRKLLHVLVAIVAVPMLLILPFQFVLAISILGIGVIVSTWMIERMRLQKLMLEPYREMVHEPLAKVLESTRRPTENFPWSPVLYTLSLIIIGLAHIYLGLSWALAFSAYAILGIGDAVSALVGVAYGRTKLPWNRKKSVEGTAAGLLSGFLAGVVMGVIPFGLAGLHVPPLFVLVVLGGAIAGALAETLPRVEDNFVVPLTAAGVMLGLAQWLAVTLP